MVITWRFYQCESTVTVAGTLHVWPKHDAFSIGHWHSSGVCCQVTRCVSVMDKSVYNVSKSAGNDLWFWCQQIFVYLWVTLQFKGALLYSHVSWAHSSHNRNYSAFINVQSDRQLNAVKMKTGPNTNPNPILITFLKWNTRVYIDILEGFYFGHNY